MTASASTGVDTSTYTEVCRVEDIDVETPTSRTYSTFTFEPAQ